MFDAEKHISDFVFVEQRLVGVYLFHQGKLVQSELYMISNMDSMSFRYWFKTEKTLLIPM